jgi:hypothetical protein
MLNIMLADEPRIFETLNCDLPPPEPRPYEFMDPHLKDLGVKVRHVPSPDPIGMHYSVVFFCANWQFCARATGQAHALGVVV